MRRLIKAAVHILGTVGIMVCLVWIAVAQPSCRRNDLSRATVDPVKLRKHVETLSRQFYPRSWDNRSTLDQCAEHIAQHFGEAGAIVEYQSVTAYRKQYRNVIGRFNPGRGARVVVGAHYDACEDTPGADDNASGVAALIELAYLFGESTATNAVELVAYVLEEPPFFRTAFMGSATHAKSMSEDKANVRGVIVLEMVGNFSDEWGSQAYPVPLLRLMYPSRANFIAVASRWDQGDWIKKVKSGMKQTTDLPVYSIRAPAFLPGIDFSDHLNYWPYGIKALMITDTAFYRNRMYHKKGDTADRLDYRRMSKVVVALFETLKST